MTAIDAHRDPGADRPEEWVRPAQPVHNHGAEDGPGLDCPERVVGGSRIGGCLKAGATVQEWRMVARLLRDNADRFPNDSTARAMAAFCAQEADHMDREAVDLESLAIAIGGECNDRVIWNGLTEYERDTYRRAARAAVAHLADRLAPAVDRVRALADRLDERGCLHCSSLTGGDTIAAEIRAALDGEALS